VREGKVQHRRYVTEYQLWSKNTGTKIDELEIFYKNGVFHFFGTVHTDQGTGRFCSKKTVARASVSHVYIAK